MYTCMNNKIVHSDSTIGSKLCVYVYVYTHMYVYNIYIYIHM